MAEDSELGVFRGYPMLIRRFAFAGRDFELFGPGNFESLIDDPAVVARFAKEEFMPYWAEFWPACLLLADLVESWPQIPQSADSATRARVLELGAGLGLPSLIALHRGYRVMCSDYHDDALAFVGESARRNGLSPPELRYVDWRERYPELRFERIIAAEVLYEKRNLAPIAWFIAHHLTAGGQALLVDRNRPTADAFPAIAREAGLTVDVAPLRRPGYLDSKPLEGRAFLLSAKPV